jgi:hypothetical protein
MLTPFVLSSKRSSLGLPAHLPSVHALKSRASQALQQGPRFLLMVSLMHMEVVPPEGLMQEADVPLHVYIHPFARSHSTVFGIAIAFFDRISLSWDHVSLSRKGIEESHSLEFSPLIAGAT